MKTPILHLASRQPKENDPPGYIKPACGVIPRWGYQSRQNPEKVTCKKCIKTRLYRRLMDEIHSTRTKKSRSVGKNNDS